MAADGARRLLTLQRAGKEAGMALEGVPAGCGFATTWVQLFLLEAVGNVYRYLVDNPLELDIFIDDFGLTGCGFTEQQIAQKLCEGAAALKQMLEDEFG